jgi:DNA-binding response OmpR family regulator
MTTILLVDPDPDGRSILRTYLEHHGFRVLDAADGDTGLELIREHDPDLVIGDFPIDVPGYSPFTGAASDLGYEGPILTVTARAREDQVEAAEAVSQRVLTKPVSPARVLAAVRSLLDREGG